VIAPKVTPLSFSFRSYCTSETALLGQLGKALPGGRWVHAPKEDPWSTRTLAFFDPPLFLSLVSGRAV